MKRKTMNVVSKDVAVGDLMALTYWVSVEARNADGSELTVKNLENNSEFKVFGKELIEKSKSADQHQTTEFVTQTQIAEIFIDSYNCPLTVCFVKDDGTPRKMRCRLLKPNPVMGRSMVEELGTSDKNKIRQVDHRTIEWLIVDCIKYEVK